MTHASLDEMLAQLNPAQRDAVTDDAGPLLVLAGAGSGKTRVITVRMAWLIQKRLRPSEVLALTFTNKAAGEMGERVAELVGEEAAKQITTGTFHSLGLKMLEEDAPKLGIPRDFTLLDAADQAGAVRQCLRQLRMDPLRHDPRLFLGMISNARNAGTTPEQFDQDPGQKLMGRVYRAYLEWLDAYRALDFDDLILRPLQLLREHPEAREKWCGRFRTILVDEYQDTNGAQFELVKLLAAEHQSLCVVGDDDQSIYGWRGARIENILGFEDHFPGARVVKLTQNYRSTGHILKCANHVIGHNTERREKDLWTSEGDGQKVGVVVVKTGIDEASFIASRIDRLVHEEGMRPSDIGVLFRASAQAPPVEQALSQAGIPYRVVGASDFFERKEVRDLLSYLKLVANPQDRSSLIRVINFPSRGIGPKALAGLQDFAQRRSLSPFRALANADEIPGISPLVAAEMLAFHAMITDARDHYADHGDLAGLANHLIDVTSAREAWIRDPTEGPGGVGRWKSIEALLRSMTTYQRKRGSVELRDYVRLVALDRKTASEGEPISEVAMMSIHASKGLEWPVCFVVGCEEGLLPHQRVLDEHGDTAEERRLFYVAMTRARRQLYLTRATMRKRFRGSVPTRPSRFLGELPVAHIEIVLRAEGGGVPGKVETRDRFAALRARLKT